MRVPISADVIALSPMDPYLKTSFLARISSKNPREVWGAVAGSPIAVFGKPRGVRMDGGGEWENEVWTTCCAERNTRPQLQGKGAHPRMMDCRNAFVRGIFRRPHAKGHINDRANLDEVRKFLGATPQHGRFSACHIVFGANPAGLHMWKETYDEIVFVQENLASSHFSVR